jgi:NAD(P)-dependent dehydrogenase (short-subunit alcohol dehydrogenase family)
MRRGGRGGSILNVASIEAVRAAPNFAVYAACKAGMVSFTKTMACELADDRIRVNVICPDHTITPGNHGNRSGPVDEASWPKDTPERLDAWRRLVPAGGEGHVDQCGRAAVYLCSAMGDYVTGAMLAVDGGTMAAGGWFKSKGTDHWTLMEGLGFGASAAPA